ncbi:MAG TPA: glycosyltransferase [Firmicutes bacterium]|nr:glycosyltransferase [Bacillota bacterium]
MEYPELNLTHLKRLTDDTGIIQHAKYHLPNRATGYTTDDNARALLAAVEAWRLTGRQEALELAEVYLAFLYYAQLPSGRFHNFMHYDRTWADKVGSQDSFGRAVWALGGTAATLAGKGSGAVARELFLRALPWTVRLKALRAQAFALLGLTAYLGVHPEPLVKGAAATLAQKLAAAYHQEASEEWAWFEDRLTYSNGALPAALFAAYRRLGGHELLEVAERSLAFLTDVLWQGRYFKLVGCHGWYI